MRTVRILSLGNTCVQFTQHIIPKSRRKSKFVERRQTSDGFALKCLTVNYVRAQCPRWTRNLFYNKFTAMSG